MINRLKQVTNTKLILVIIVLSIIVRSAYSIYYFNKFGYTNLGDGIDYISYAEQIDQQGIFVPDIDKIFTNGHQTGIGWPFIIYLIFSIFGKTLWFVFVFNILISSLHSVLIFGVAKQLFGKSIAIISAFWAIFYINFIKFTPTLLKENVIHFLLFLTIYLLIRFLKNKSRINLFTLIAVYSFFIHLDERYFALLPLILISFYSFKGSFTNSLKLSFIFCLTLLLTMTPWLIRNYLVYKRPVILAYQTSEFTDKLFGYTSENIFTGYENAPSSYSRKYLKDYEKITQSIINNQPIDSSYKRYCYIKEIKEGVKIGMIPHTYSYSENLLEEFKEFFRPFRFKPGYVANGYRLFKARPLINNYIIILQYGILLPFFILGIFYSFLNRENLPKLILLLFFVYSAIHILLVHSMERYRIPVDGIIIIFAFYGLSYLNKFGKSKNIIKK